MLSCRQGPVGPPGNPPEQAGPEIARVTVNPATVELLVGDSARLATAVYDASGNRVTGQAVTWIATDETVVTVTDDGSIVARTPGTARVVATAGPASGWARITVGARVAGIRLEADSLTLVQATSQRVRAALHDGRGRLVPPRPISWSSRDTSIVTVSGDGVASAHGVGVTMVVAAHESVRDSLSVRVVADSFVGVSAGMGHSCAVRRSGRAECWGSNDHGQLGDGTATDRLIPTPVAGDQRYVAISAGTGFSCALATDGRVFCWGDNSMKELGNPVGRLSYVPVAVLTDERFVSISTSDMAHACALAADGRGFCWGYNRWGQLGIGTSADMRFPVEISGGLRFRTLHSAHMRTCAVADDQRAYCWGSGDPVQLGSDTVTYDTCSGTTPCVTAPRRVGGAIPFRLVSTGRRHTCAIGETDQLYCWGWNDDGQVGVGTTDSVVRPEPVGLAVRAVSTAGRHTCAVALTGQGYCWGFNGGGRLGTGATPDVALLPTRVAGSVAFTAIATGVDHTCAVGMDGAVYCWGGNGMGQLGNGNRAASAVPVPVFDPATGR